MPDRRAGRYVRTTVAGERVPAFVPCPLPALPPVLLGASAARLDAATLRPAVAFLAAKR